MTNILLVRNGVGNPTANLIAERSATGLIVVNKDTDKIPEDVNYAFRWATTSNLPRESKVVNKASSIHLVYNKPLMRKSMRRFDLCPITFMSFDEIYNVKDYIPEHHYPIIVRPKHHQRGDKFHRAYNFASVDILTNNFKGEGIEDIYYTVWVEVEEEVRVVVSSGRVVWCCKNDNANRRWDNIKWGSWNLLAVEKALAAMKLSGLDFGAVDVLVDSSGNVYVTEINSGPEILGDYQPTKMAQAFDYIVENGRGDIPIVEDEENGWRKFIHPVVSDEAKVA